MTKIFVIDDEADIVSIFTRILSESGYETYGYTDPVKALESLNEIRPDLMLVDIRMPGMDGFVFVDRAQKMKPKAKVVFITAYEVFAGDFGKLLPATKVDAILKKPVRSETLLHTVESILSKGKY